jgi:hypothetical protein
VGPRADVDVAMKGTVTVVPCWLATMVTKVAWGFLIQSLPWAKPHVSLYAKFQLLLYHLNQNWNVSIKLVKLSNMKFL